MEDGVQIKIGELLVRAGVVTSMDLSEAEKLSKHMQMQFGRILIMSGCLTEHQLECALDAQRLIREELLTIDVACEALLLAAQQEMPLNAALEQLDIVPQYGTATITLAEILLECEIMNPDDLEAALHVSLETNMPLAECLIIAKTLSPSLVPVIEKTQSEIRRGTLIRDEAIEEIRNTHAAWMKAEESLSHDPMAQSPVVKTELEAVSAAAQAQSAVSQSYAHPAQGFVPAPNAGYSPQPPQPQHYAQQQWNQSAEYPQQQQAAAPQYQEQHYYQNQYQQQQHYAAQPEPEYDDHLSIHQILSTYQEEPTPEPSEETWTQSAIEAMMAAQQVAPVTQAMPVNPTPPPQPVPLAPEPQPMRPAEAIAPPVEQQSYESVMPVAMAEAISSSATLAAYLSQSPPSAQAQPAAVVPPPAPSPPVVPARTYAETTLPQSAETGAASLFEEAESEHRAAARPPISFSPSPEERVSVPASAAPTEPRSVSVEELQIEEPEPVIEQPVEPLAAAPDSSLEESAQPTLQHYLNSRPEPTAHAPSSSSAATAPQPAATSSSDALTAITPGMRPSPPVRRRFKRSGVFVAEMLEEAGFLAPGELERTFTSLLEHPAAALELLRFMGLVDEDALESLSECLVLINDNKVSVEEVVDALANYRKTGASVAQALGVAAPPAVKPPEEPAEPSATFDAYAFEPEEEKFTLAAETKYSWEEQRPVDMEPHRPVVVDLDQPAPAQSNWADRSALDWSPSAETTAHIEAVEPAPGAFGQEHGAEDLPAVSPKPTIDSPPPLDMTDTIISPVYIAEEDDEEIIDATPFATESEPMFASGASVYSAAMFACATNSSSPDESAKETTEKSESAAENESFALETFAPDLPAIEAEAENLSNSLSFAAPAEEKSESLAPVKVEKVKKHGPQPKVRGAKNAKAQKENQREKLQPAADPEPVAAPDGKALETAKTKSKVESKLNQKPVSQVKADSKSQKAVSEPKSQTEAEPKVKVGAVSEPQPSVKVNSKEKSKAKKKGRK